MTPALPPQTPPSLSRLFSAQVDSFESCLERELSQQAGSELRDAYLLEMFARRVCDGNYLKAAQIVDTQIAMLGGRSPREVAETDSGLLEIRRRVADRAWCRQVRGVCAFTQATLAERDRNLSMLMDFLPMAWGFSDPEFAQLLRVPEEWLEHWRSAPAKLDEEIAQRLLRLRELHESMRKLVVASELAAVWRCTWSSSSTIGSRSLWQAYLDDGDSALDAVENFLLTAAEVADG